MKYTRWEQIAFNNHFGFNGQGEPLGTFSFVDDDPRTGEMVAFEYTRLAETDRFSGQAPTPKLGERKFTFDQLKRWIPEHLWAEFLTNPIPTKPLFDKPVSEMTNAEKARALNDLVVSS